MASSFSFEFLSDVTCFKKFKKNKKNYFIYILFTAQELK